MQRRQVVTLVTAGVLSIASCSREDSDAADEPDTALADARADTLFAPLAEDYVKLVLSVGQHDAGYVDAYYGPAEWQRAVAAEKPSLDSIKARAARLSQQIDSADVDDASELVQLRGRYLSRQLAALSAYMRMLQGERLSFDDESRALYDAVAPTYDEAHFRSLVDSLGAVLPGSGPVPARLEHHLVRGRNWPEYSVYPLYSLQSLIAEGSANYGIDVAFPGAARLTFERDILFPLAGLDPARAEEYARVRAIVDRLSYAGNEAARAYLNGSITAGSAAKWLNAYALMEPARAQQRVKFIATYRSYVINYNYGLDMVRQYVESRGGTADNAARRRDVFKELLSTPRLPSDLR